MTQESIKWSFLNLPEVMASFLSTNNTKVHPQDYKHKCPGGHYFPKQSPYDCPKQPVTVIRLDTVSKVLWNSSIHQLRLYVVSDLK